MEWVYLYVAIAAEVMATSALKASASFTQLVPSIIVVVGYSTAFYLLTLALQKIPLGVAYAIWSAFGMALVAHHRHVSLRREARRAGHHRHGC